MMPALLDLFTPGQLQNTWVFWILLALVALDLYFLGRVIIRPQPAPPAGPWAQQGPSGATLRLSAWVSLILALAYGTALILGATVALVLAVAYAGPAIYRYILQEPFARTPREIGSNIGSLIGSGLQILLMVAGVVSIAPHAKLDLRHTGSIQEPPR